MQVYYNTRFSRIKNDEQFPVKSIEFVLNKGNIKLGELDKVVIAGTSINLNTHLMRKYSSWSISDQFRLMDEFWRRKLLFGETPNYNEIFNYSDNFLKDIIENLIKEKKEYLSNPKVNEFNTKLISIFGKSFNDSEIDDLTKSKDEDFQTKIIKKFHQKRNERIKLLGEDRAKEIEKRIFLQTVDISWKSHIQYLEQLRQVIGLRSYGQRDPLVEYKKEAFNLFENLLIKLKTDLVTILINLSIVQETFENNETQIIPKKKMKRNEPCYCGSGKKYKHCCGAL